MNKSILQFLKFVVGIAVAGGLLYLALPKNSGGGINFQTVGSGFRAANYFWVALCFFFGFVATVFRAARWNMLMEPLGYNPGLLRSFAAIMFGYLVNLALPRAGEVSRCTALQRTDQIPFSKSFGTVVTERILDLLCLFFVFLLSLLLEFGRIKDFFYGLAKDKLKNLGNTSGYFALILAVFALILIVIFLFVFFRKRIASSVFYLRIKNFLKGFISGIRSIQNIKSPLWFVFHSISIWALYIVMTYVAFFALGETDNLTFSAGIVITAVGAMGMSAPVQGGFGVYHVLVANALFLYSIPYQSGLVFATIVHATQFFLILVSGSLSLLYLSIQKRNVPNRRENYT